MAPSIFDSDGNLMLAMRELRRMQKEKVSAQEEKKESDTTFADNASIAASILIKRHPELSALQVSVHRNKVLIYFVYKHKSTSAIVPDELLGTVTSALDVLDNTINTQIEYYCNDRYGK